MTQPSLLALVLIVGGVVPLAWSGVLVLGRTVAGNTRWRRIIATERAEQLVLVLMIAPVLLGFAFLVAALLAPATVSALPPIVRMDPVSWSNGAFASTAIIPQAAAHPVDWAMLLTRTVALLYLTGVLCLLARFVRARRRLGNILRNAVDESHVWGEGVRITDAQVPPFASGPTNIILPRSLIPHLSPDQVIMVVRHEQAHLARRDPALFLAFALTEIALWFNPMIKRQIGRCRLAAELACDHAAMSTSPETSSAPAMRKAYAQSLVLALKHGAGDAMFCAPAVVPSGNIGDYHMRISEIMQPTRLLGTVPVRAPVIAAMLLSGPVIFVQATLAGAAVQAPDTSAPLIVPTIGSPKLENGARIVGNPSLRTGAGEVFASSTDMLSPVRHVVTARPAMLAAPDQAAEYASGAGQSAAHDSVTVNQTEVQVAQPRGRPESWVTEGDYPPAARTAQREGIAGIRLTINDAGRATGCTITSSSGWSDLDAVACALVHRRSRFNVVDSDNGQASRIWDTRVTFKLPPVEGAMQREDVAATQLAGTNGRPPACATLPEFSTSVCVTGVRRRVSAVESGSQ